MRWLRDNVPWLAVVVALIGGTFMVRAKVELLTEQGLRQQNTIENLRQEVVTLNANVKVLTQVVSGTSGVQETLKDHEERLRRLERGK